MTGEPLPDPIFPPTPAQEVADELTFHVDMQMRELIALGVEPAAARARAVEQFRDLDRVGDECRRIAEHRDTVAGRLRFLGNLRQDIHFALRMLKRRPAFAVLAILTIALGIGAATAIYSVVDGVMLRPLPFNDPGKLIAIWITEQRFHDDPTLASWWDQIPLGAEDYQALQQAHSFRDVALFSRGGGTLVTPGGSRQVNTVEATSNLLATLGLRPAIGRGILPGEDALNGPRVALLSWEMWQSAWHGDTSVLGHSVRFGSQDYTIVGVLPRGLRLDRTLPIGALWTAALTDSQDIPARHNRDYAALARLVPGYTTAQANAEATAMLRASTAAARGETKAKGVGARVEQWQLDQARGVRASLWILFSAVVLLLLIACANVATLMLGEAVRREREISARLALGAGPWRIARQLLTESVTLALVGAALGAALGWVGMKLLVSMAPARIPGLSDVRLDLRVLGFAVVCALSTGLLFGLVPAMLLLRRGTRGIVRVGAGQTGRDVRWGQHVVIGVEVALSLVLLVGSSLLGHSLRQVATVDPGFNVRDLRVIETVQQSGFWRDEDRVRNYYTHGVHELAAIPGVVAVSDNSLTPFNGNSSSSPVKVDDKTYADGESEGNSQQRHVPPGYFRTLGIPLLAGRDFGDQDRKGGELSIIVSETEAHRDWPSRPPLGHRLYWQGKWRTVVGMVGDVQYAKLTRDYEPTVYLPFDQEVSGGEFVVRVRPGIAGIDAAIHQRLSSIDAGVIVDSIKSMRDMVGHSYAEERYRALLSSLFGSLAGVLAAIGIFGVLSRSVARRMREAGIRVALGAPSSALTRLLLRDVLTGVGAGLLAGIGASLLVARLLAPYLYGVTTHDPVAFGGSVVLIGVATGLATLPPARRASRVDPAQVLRME
jgi:putative ABC transport system permease protein